MRTKTKGNTDRRVVRYGNYDDFLNDAELCTQEPVRTLGNWSQSQIYSHLAMLSNHASTERDLFCMLLFDGSFLC